MKRFCYKCYGTNDFTCYLPKGHDGPCGATSAQPQPRGSEALRELLVKADSMLSYLHHRGYIHYERKNVPERQEVEELISKLRAAATAEPRGSEGLPTGNNHRYDGLEGNAKWIRESATHSQIVDILKRRADMFARVKELESALAAATAERTPPQDYDNLVRDAMSWRKQEMDKSDRQPAPPQPDAIPPRFEEDAWLDAPPQNPEPYLIDPLKERFLNGYAAGEQRGWTAAIEAAAQWFADNWGDDDAMEIDEAIRSLRPSPAPPQARACQTDESGNHVMNLDGSHAIAVCWCNPARKDPLEEKR